MVCVCGGGGGGGRESITAPPTGSSVVGWPWVDSWELFEKPWVDN